MGRPQSVPVLEMRGITKQFPGVLANDNVDFRLEKGEIHALLGENGAGKTTLMKILYGLYEADEGMVLVDGEEVSIKEPNDAINLGIGMVHQHFMLIPPFRSGFSRRTPLSACAPLDEWSPSQVPHGC
jgi:ABC-type uncharacterized transport system ATPase subunit